MVQLAACARAWPHVLLWLKSPESVPVMAMLWILRVALPLLVIVTGSAGLALPTKRPLKTKLTGESVIAGAVIPRPLSETVCGLPMALSVKVMEPLRVPTAVGVKVTKMVQLPRAARLLPQLLVWAKSPLAAIVRLMSARTGLVLGSVTDCGAHGEPTGWRARFMCE